MFSHDTLEKSIIKLEIVGPLITQQYRTIAAVNVSIWDSLTRLIESNSVDTGAAFVGVWSSVVIGVWLLEVLVNSSSFAHTGRAN